MEYVAEENALEYFTEADYSGSNGQDQMVDDIKRFIVGVGSFLQKLNSNVPGRGITRTHSDINPANVLFGKEMVKVADFGVADQFRGTPHTMSPLQFYVERLKKKMNLEFEIPVDIIIDWFGLVNSVTAIMEILFKQPLRTYYNDHLAKFQPDKALMTSSVEFNAAFVYRSKSSKSSNKDLFLKALEKGGVPKQLINFFDDSALEYFF